MDIYLLQNKDSLLDASLSKALESMSFIFTYVDLPKNHENLIPCFGQTRGGLVFLPPLWTDLTNVKIIQELGLSKLPFVTIIAGPMPKMQDLIVAYNEGLTAFLEIPVENTTLRLMLGRATSCFERLCEQIDIKENFINLSALSIPHNRSKAMMLRNLWLGKAFVDMANRKGPFVDGSIEVLLVSSSSVQQNMLEKALKSIGVSVIKVGTLNDAIQKADNKAFQVVISDNVLPDGDAVMLTSHLQKTSSKMPYMIVWSSSPAKAVDLLKPENHIDEVIEKPAPESGIEAILPSIISVVYQALE